MKYLNHLLLLFIIINKFLFIRTNDVTCKDNKVKCEDQCKSTYAVYFFIFFYLDFIYLYSSWFF